MVKLRLAVLLAERGMTRADLARITGIRPNTIGELYRSTVERVSLEHLDLICNVLGCRLNELLVRDED